MTKALSVAADAPPEGGYGGSTAAVTTSGSLAPGTDGRVSAEPPHEGIPNGTLRVRRPLPSEIPPSCTGMYPALLDVVLQQMFGRHPSTVVLSEKVSCSLSLSLERLVDR